MSEVTHLQLHRDIGALQAKVEGNAGRIDAMAAQQAELAAQMREQHDELTQELKRYQKCSSDQIGEMHDILMQAKGARWALGLLVTAASAAGGLLVWFVSKLNF